MGRSLLIILTILLFSVNLFSQKDNIDSFPFSTSRSDGIYLVSVYLESEEIFNKYYSFFEKHGYVGNGYCWEGHIIQILEKKDKELINHIVFDPEAGAFFAYADTEKNQQKFVELLSPIFSDLTELEKYVLSADRTRIDD